MLRLQSTVCEFETAKARIFDGRGRDRAIALQFGHSYFVTASWNAGPAQRQPHVINAGHVLPMLVRNGTYAGPLQCKPSRPFGLGGPVVETAEQISSGRSGALHTDGITRLDLPGIILGEDRLADLLVRASLENLPAGNRAASRGSITSFHQPPAR